MFGTFDTFYTAPPGWRARHGGELVLMRRDIAIVRHPPLEFTTLESALLIKFSTPNP